MTKKSGPGRKPEEEGEPSKGEPTIEERATALVQAVWDTCNRKQRGEVPQDRAIVALLVVDAWKRGQQGEFAVRDFRNGNPTLQTYSYGQRRDRLQADLAILKADKLVFDRPGEENMAELRRVWEDGRRRARERYGKADVPTLGEKLPVAGREPGQEG